MMSAVLLRRIATTNTSRSASPALLRPVSHHTNTLLSPFRSFPSPSALAFAVPGYSNSFSSSVPRASAGAHAEETFEEFNARYEKEFEGVQDVFELQVCYFMSYSPEKQASNLLTWDEMPRGI